MSNIIDSQHLCFECGACSQICATDAILMRKNQDGFSYPEVDADKCVNCGLCEKVCPAINANQVKNEVSNIFAAQSKEQKLLQQSSSGGIFAIVAELVIKKGGIVFGAAWDNDLQLNHVGVESIEGLKCLMGSKYVHSNIGDTYKEAREILKNDRWVYYTGTPCQIAGLKLFLRKDYPTLITSDLVCHGTPPQDMFNKFVHQMEEDNGIKIINYSFRDKRIMGWSSTSTALSKDKCTGKYKYHIYDKNMSAYYNAFIMGHITREDCYSCPFSCPQRVGDITLADYWDVNKHHSDIKHLQDGVSLLLINTDRGKQILDKIKKKLILVPSTIEKALATNNHNLKAPTPKPKERDYAFKNASVDFISFRDRYIPKDKDDNYYRRIYRNHKIKSLPIIKQLLSLFGKA